MSNQKPSITPTEALAAKEQASAEFVAADVAYDEALRKFEAAVLAKDVARKTLAWATTAYQTAKAETND